MFFRRAQPRQSHLGSRLDVTSPEQYVRAPTSPWVSSCFVDHRWTGLHPEKENTWHAISPGVRRVLPVAPLISPFPTGRLYKFELSKSDSSSLLTKSGRIAVLILGPDWLVVAGGPQRVEPGMASSGGADSGGPVDRCAPTIGRVPGRHHRCGACRTEGRAVLQQCRRGSPDGRRSDLPEDSSFLRRKNALRARRFRISGLRRDRRGRHGISARRDDLL